MPIKNKRDPIPEEFSSYEEAGEFWDTHDSMDYEDLLEDVEFKVNLRKRHFMVYLDSYSAKLLQDKAQEKGIPPSQLASEILKQQLVAVG